jgi:hypothetical protein
MSRRENLAARPLFQRGLSRAVKLVAADIKHAIPTRVP